MNAMTGRERILALLAGQQADHISCMPITMMFAADILGVKYGQYVRDHKLIAEAQVKAAEMFGFDHVSTISDPACEASDLGANIRWYEDQPPAIIEDDALFADKISLARVKVPDFIAGERMSNRVQAIELMRERVGKDLLVEGWVEGPCAEGADLRGLNRLMTDFSDDPEFVHDLFAFALERAIYFAKAQIDAGADIIGVGDAAASLLGPRVYEKFVWPYEKKLVDSIHANGGKVRLHICGNTRRILGGMGKLGCDMVDIDYPVAMEQARSEMGPKQALAGNLDPVRGLRNGSPKTITQALERLQREGGLQWIVAAGCEIVRDTPHENVHTLTSFARTHARNEIGQVENLRRQDV